ncbi:zinc-dependent metalloprotease [Piscinibacter sp.]|uniref:zinc-dependent metalloprotease n=1 Tax=Piscinibacter sp. TaxID=1903157 RepID=UPI003559C3B7
MKTIASLGPIAQSALRVSSLLLPLLAGCASLPSTGASAAAAAATNDAATTAAAPHAAASAASAASRSAQAAAAASGLRPFADVIKDATRIDGLFTLWQKDDRVWLELKASDFAQPFFLSPKIKTGIGEGSFFGGLMADEVVIEFRRIHNQVQMLARNTEYVAQANTPSARAVSAAFSPSLLASTGVLSQPHPERQSVLVEANALFVNDMLGTGTQLQRHYRQGYSLDLRNSAITALRATPELLVIETMNHYATGSIAPAQGSPGPSVPRSLPDPRSLFMSFHYSLARLPEQPMHARKADGRVGYFTSSTTDFTDDLARTPRQRFVNRWRLEKKDPSAALSDPVKPITFWLDRSIPEKYRTPITAGVLEWNKAFEQIGFSNALQVEVQPDDAAWDTLDFGRASIRWMTNSSPTFGAIGPSHVDPRSGEILDADIGVESLSSRNLRALRSQILAPAASGALEHDAQMPTGLRGMRAQASCNYADQAAEQLSYGLDVLEARGDIDPASPEAEKFVADYLKDTTMHEVGHTLGLRHNFRSSRIYSDAQLSDPTFTATHSLTGSVMEYAPINLAAPGVPREMQPAQFNTTLGPYDYWAIEYAYKPIAPDQEDAELARIAARSAEPQLAYGTDEDNFLGIDPESLQFDLGSDVVGFARKRVAIARDLLARQETRQLAAGRDYSVLRRSVGFALRDMGRAAGLLTRQIGGVRTLRDHAGSGRDPLLPVPAAEQRAALDVLTAGFLSVDSFKVSPALQRKLALDYQERTEAYFGGEAMVSTDFSLASQVIELQRGVLAQLLSDGVAARLLDSESKSPTEALRLSELYSRLDQSVWSELGAQGDVPALRRELQREHVNRVAGMLLRPASLSRADARSLVRFQAQALLARIGAAARRPGLSAEARAHLQDSADTLSQALSAKLQRAGV